MIRTLKLSKLVAPDLRHKPRSHRNLHHLIPIRKYLNSVLGKHDVGELHNTAKLGTVHMLGKVLTKHCKKFVVGNNITFTTEELRNYVP